MTGTMGVMPSVISDYENSRRKSPGIKVIKRIAYGYRNAQNFRQRILLTNLKEAGLKAA